MLCKKRRKKRVSRKGAYLRQSRKSSKNHDHDDDDDDDDDVIMMCVKQLCGCDGWSKNQANNTSKKRMKTNDVKKETHATKTKLWT